MSLIKSSGEISLLRDGGALLSRTLREIREACIAGVTTGALDAIARNRFAEAGGTGSFLGYRIAGKGKPYPGVLCVSLNDEVVHGLPIPDRVIKNGDVVGLDIGVWWKGLCTDMATTVIVGDADERTRALVADTRESLVRALAAVKAGNDISQIGETIEDFLKSRKYKYGIVRDLVGHGVGHAVHEDPPIPNFRDARQKPMAMQAGMVIAIEPMITLGDWRVDQLDDGWTIVTADGSTAAHFEVTVAVTEGGYELLTPWPDEEESTK